MKCYNLSGEPKDDDELHNVNILEFEGSRDVAAPDILIDLISQPLRIRKVNIGSKENPKFANVGDYWDKETISKITDLLHEFHVLFLTWLLEMKGILGDLGEMKILLKPDAKPVWQRSYRLNPWYKDCVKAEIDQILDAGIIEPIEESEWIIPMVV